MSLYKYDRYKILLDPESHKTQGLQVGDVVRRQYLDGKNLIYSLMIVLQTGIDIILDKTGKELESSYFIGALIEGNEPVNGELLDFVRTTNLFNADRSGALYLTASDSEAPFMDIIDGMAFENSLCYPIMGEGRVDEADSERYSCIGTDFVTSTYFVSQLDAHRVFRITRNGNVPVIGDVIGFKQTLKKRIHHPQRVIISYKIRASHHMENIQITFGYTDGMQIEGTDTIEIETEWSYKLMLVTVDYPEQYPRSLLIDMTSCLRENDWCEISDLNIVLLSDIAVISNGTKARIGKIKGIVDPLFGVLDGYGAYFQNLYATHNVNVAGTLTAGDKTGFASTFYVGRIHKNCLINSLYGNFVQAVLVSDTEKAPAGIGHVFQLSSTTTEYICQNSEWKKKHIGEKYCFSFWAKSKQLGILSFMLDGEPYQEIHIEKENEWKRYWVSFLIAYKEETALRIGLTHMLENLYFCSPQLEAGERATLYQATDGTLTDTDEFGAWFCRGGIGGTIQNPLLRLNEDGSIEAGNKSFVINPDGTGYLANGRFSWTEDTITLQDITIRWEDFDENTQKKLLPKSVSIDGPDIFHYVDTLDQTDVQPDKIELIATEHNFSSTSSKWQYLSIDNLWKDISTGSTYVVTPSLHVWEGQDILTLRYKALWEETEFISTYTITKQYDGQDSYSVYVASSHGETFRNGIISTILSATVYKGGIDVTDKIPEYNFKWRRISNDQLSDELWNSKEHIGKSLGISEEDVYRKAVFDCEITISNS